MCETLTLTDNNLCLSQKDKDSLKFMIALAKKKMYLDECSEEHIEHEAEKDNIYENILAETIEKFGQPIPYQWEVK